MAGDRAAVVNDSLADDIPGRAGNTRQMSIRLKKWGPLLVLASLMVLAFSQGVHNELTLSNLIMERQRLAGFVGQNLALSIVAYVTIYAVSVSLSFPGASLLTIAGGFLFGWILAGVATVVGATAGATALFLVARSSVGEALTKRAGPFLAKLTEGFRKDAFHYLLFLRLTPVFPFWLVNIAPALFQVPLRSYVLATFVGIVPGTFAFTFIGAGLDSVIAAQEAANPGCAAAGTCQIEISALVTPELIAAFFALGIASLIPIVLKRLRSR